MNELSLYSGAGGGLLATKWILGWRTTGYVEWNEYCQQIIRARINDGYLDAAPIFGDIRAFLSEGYAERYRDMVDVITAGFPCQPFSTAGKRYGSDDERNMWPATIECIRVVRPRFALLENVPGLLNVGYFGTILGDLAESGYDARWKVLSAAELGAPHKRDRLWIVAYNTQSGDGSICVQSGESEQENIDTDGSCEVMADAECCGFDWEQWWRAAQQFEDGSANVADTESDTARGLSIGENEEVTESGGDGTHVSHTGSARLSQREWTHGEWTHTATARGDWWSVEPGLDRVAHGVAYRMERLRAIGNGQVPAVAGCIWKLLSRLNN